jgi:hypothetical protein
MSVDEVCAPGIHFLGGSCIPLDLLEDMIHVYNLSHDDKIDIDSIQRLKQYNPITYKKKIVEILTTRMKNYNCDTQTCWLTLPFFRNLSDSKKTKRLHKQTFKPKGPSDSNKWLNTLNIDDVFEQYENYYKDFKFMGANPRDFADIPSTGIPNMDLDSLLNSGKYRLGFIFNLDKHNQSGSHWVAMFADILKGHIYYIDSVGEPPMKEFVALMNKIKKFCLSSSRENYCRKNPQNEICKSITDFKKIDLRYSKTQHQHGGSECGVYAINFILRWLDGETFDELTKNQVGDKEVQMCRRAYFRKQQSK